MNLKFYRKGGQRLVIWRNNGTHFQSQEVSVSWMELTEKTAQYITMDLIKPTTERNFVC